MIPELRTLLAIARYGTFSAAGDKIGLTQSAVSGHMRRLEEMLGFELFERTGRSAILNPAGQRTLARAQEIVARIEALGTPDADETAVGRLRIGAIGTTLSTILADAIAPFRNRFAKMHLHIVPGISLYLLDQLDSGDLDLAVMIKPSFGMPRDFLWHPLGREPYVLITPTESPDDDWQYHLKSRPFLRYDRTSFGGRQVDRFLRSHAITPQESVEIDDIPTMVAMTAKGLGVALLPLSRACLPLPAGVRTLSLGDQTFYRDIGILYHPRNDSPALSHLCNCLHNAAGTITSTPNQDML